MSFSRAFVKSFLSWPTRHNVKGCFIFHHSFSMFAHTSTVRAHVLTNTLYFLTVMLWLNFSRLKSNFSVWLSVHMSVCVFVLFGRCHCTDYNKQNTGKCQASTTPQIQTYCNDGHKSALAFSQRGTYYYRVAQSQTLHAFAFSVFLLTVHSSYSCCFMHVGCWDILVQKNPVLWHGPVHSHFLIFLLYSKLLFWGVCGQPSLK